MEEFLVFMTLKNLIEFLSHPLLIAIVSIFLGSGLIDRINRKREKRESTRKEVLKLIEEICDLLNNDITLLFGQVRNQTTVINQDFVLASRKAFMSRLKIKVKVKTYLKDDGVLKEYDEIIQEIAKVRRNIENYNEDLFNVEEINEHINKLKLKWNITIQYPIEELKHPFNVYFSWSQVIWFRAELFITKLLYKVNSMK